MGRSPADRAGGATPAAAATVGTETTSGSAFDVLLRAGAVLAESLNPDVILERFAGLVVPDLADWCVIDLADEAGIRRKTVAHVDPDKVVWARELQERYPPDPNAPLGAPRVIRTGEPEIFAEITDELLRRAARDDQHFELMNEVGMTSAMVVPMVARGRILGAVTLVATDSSRRYGDRELGIARALAARAALAIENARLFKEVQEAGFRYETLVQTVEGIVWEADPQTSGFTFVSRRAEGMLGYPIERWTEPGFLERILHPDDRAQTLTHFRSDAPPDAETRDAFFRVYRADGKCIWLRDILHAGQATAGDHRLRGLMVDVTERKGIERRLAAHLAATRTLADAPTLTEAARNLLRGVGEALGWDLAALWHVDPSAAALRCVDVWTSDSVGAEVFAALTRACVFPPGVGLPGRVLAGARPQWIGDVTVDANFPRAAAAAADGLHGAFAFPVVSRGTVVGVMEFYSRWIEEPDQELLLMTETMGTEIGLFFERRWADEEIRFQKALLESQSETTIDGVIVVGTDGVTILSANRRFAELWGIDEDLLKPGRSAANLSTVFEQFADPNEAAQETLEVFQDKDAVIRREVRLADGRIFDRYTAPLFSTDGHNYGRAWYFRDVTDRVRTQRQLAAAKERMEFLAEASSVFAASLEADAILSSVARVAVPFVADWCIVEMIGDEGRIRRVAVTHADPSAASVAAVVAARDDYVPEDAGCVERVMRTAVAEIVARLDDPAALSGRADEAYRAAVAGLGISSYMCVPLIARGRTLGVITFAVTGTSGRLYDQGDLILGEDLARRAALALDNARLYREQSHIARVLQTSLLPPDLPEIDGVELAASYHAAGEGAEVGGDFYDVFRTGENDWAVVIGDVCGKGADAAALTALIRYTVRAAAMQARRPQRILTTLNEAVLRQREEREFCTIVYARLRPHGDRMHVTLCCGGHPLPQIVRADGTVEPAAAPGSLIGVFDAPDFTDVETDLGPGDALVLYTDGVTEARSPSGEFGDHLLPAVLADAAGSSAHEIARRIETAVLEFQAGRPRDDVAVVVLRLPPKPAG